MNNGVLLKIKMKFLKKNSEKLFFRFGKWVFIVNICFNRRIMQTFKFSEVNNEAQFTTSVSVDSVHTHVSIYLCMIGLGQVKELRGIQLFLLLGVERVCSGHHLPLDSDAIYS